MLKRLMSLLPESNTKFSVSVIVLGVISSKGDVLLPHFFETEHWVTAMQYTHVEVLDTMAKPWMETVARECPYVFQQDRAPPHNQNPPGLPEVQPEGQLSQGNLASQLTRLKSFRIFHVERI
jgi:hypothetical protein